MRRLKLWINNRKFCWRHGHKWASTKWLNNDPYDPRHIVYCIDCGKKKITYA